MDDQQHHDGEKTRTSGGDGPAASGRELTRASGGNGRSAASGRETTRASGGNGRAAASGRELLPLRVACGIGVADSAVALTTALVARPQAASVVVGIGWIVVWAVALLTVARWAAPLAARPWPLIPLGALALLPALLDGGYPGNLATQPMWIVLVAAAVAGWRVTVACAALLAAGKLALFLATGTSLDVLLRPGASDPAEATTAVLAPLAIALLGLVGVGALRSVLGALAAPAPVAALVPAPTAPLAAAGPLASAGPLAAAAPLASARPLAADALLARDAAPAAAVALSPAEQAVVGLLADGLTPKQIAHARGTSLETVRTQIKRAKRATQARTLDELVATGWRPS